VNCLKGLIKISNDILATKICKTCKINYELKNFNITNTKANGDKIYKTSCKFCMAILKRNNFPNNATNEDKEYWLKHSKANYNIKDNMIYISAESLNLNELNNKVNNNLNIKDSDLITFNKNLNKKETDLITFNNKVNNEVNNNLNKELINDKFFNKNLNNNVINFTDEQLSALKEIAINYLNKKVINLADKSKRIVKSYSIDEELIKLVEEYKQKDESNSDVVNKALNFYFMHNKKRE
jgi:hypothetical protein